MAEEKKEDIKLTESQKEVVELIKNMSVLELSQLVKAMEVEFGVSASAPVMVSNTSTNPVNAPVEEEKTSFTVVLKDAGNQKIAVIKAVKTATGLGLKEAKDLVDSAPKAIKEGLKKEDAETLKKELEDAGGKVELQ